MEYEKIDDGNSIFIKIFQVLTIMIISVIIIIGCLFLFPKTKLNSEIEPGINWNYPPEKLTLLQHKPLGQGSFGKVLLARASGIQEKQTIDVAVKITLSSLPHVKRGVEREKKIMSQLTHRNVVSLLAVSPNKNGDWLITEFCKLGSLLQNLKSRKYNQTNLKDFLSWSYQIATGMIYINEMKIVHGDLACRNIFLTEKNIVKIGDFGLARSLQEEDFYHINDDIIPSRWSAIETLKNKSLTIFSDIWSFGTTMWEIFSYGEIPYKKTKTEELIDFLERGNRLEKPILASQEIYDLMLLCWILQPTKRPTFKYLAKCLRSMIEKCKTI